MGPLLFLTLINDITECVTYSNILLYADDIKLFTSVRSYEDAARLQSDLNALVNWSEENRLPFNVGKCHKMNLTRAACREIDTKYTINNAILQTTDSVKDLGIILDKKLNLSLIHISEPTRPY